MANNTGQVNPSIFPKTPIYQIGRDGKFTTPLAMDPSWVQFFWQIYNRTGGSSGLTFPIQPNQGGTGNSSYTKGDILVASSSTALAKLAIGLNGYVLTADNSAPDGVRWDPPVGTQIDDVIANTTAALQQLSDFSSQLYNNLQINLGQQISDLQNTNDFINHDNTQFVIDSIKSVGMQTITFPFHYGDASPEFVYLMPANFFVYTAEIIMLTGFNGSGATLSVGDSGNNQRLMPITGNDPAASTNFLSNPTHMYSTPTSINIYINPGSGASQGAGYLVLTIQT